MVLFRHSILCLLVSSEFSLQSIVSIPRTDTFLLPPGFTSNISSPWLTGTRTSDPSINALLSSAQNASFISYSPEFSRLLGSHPQFELAASRPDEDFAFEGGVWAFDRDEVWFSSSTATFGNQSFISVLSLAENTVTTPDFDPPLKGVNGGYFFNNTAFFTTGGTDAALVAIDPATKKWHTVLNSYFGNQLGFVDDVTWVRKGNFSYAFFTTIGALGPLFAGGPTPFPGAVWRFDPQRGALQSVISRADIQFPNGVRVNAEGTKLYVGDSDSPYVESLLDAEAPDTTFWGSASVYSFDLVPTTSSPNSPPKPVNKSQFSLATSNGPADGLHLDSFGRVWTAEGDGIYVRSEEGEILGLFNTAPLIEGETAKIGSKAVANFALAGDVLVVLAHTRIWTLKLAEVVVKRGELS